MTLPAAATTYRKLHAVEDHVISVRQHRYTLVKQYIATNLKDTSVFTTVTLGGKLKNKPGKTLPIKTTQFVMIGKQKRIVYVGKRGARYIKFNGGFKSLA